MLEVRVANTIHTFKLQLVDKFAFLSGIFWLQNTAIMRIDYSTCNHALYEGESKAARL